MGIFDRLRQKDGRGSGDKPGQVCSYLSEKNIAFFSAGPSKQQALGTLIGKLDLPDPSVAMKSILAREEAGSTVIAPGLALPHARITGINKIQAALGISPSGIHYSKHAGDPVKLVMLFLGPAENMREHLAFLASVSALFQREELVKDLLSQTSASGVLKKIREAENKL
jgi:mannitol/fructose-specific phosphotransferase system IIA component (Ntr-type)